MTNEDTAWEQFSKADAANIGDSSAVGMLQAIMAELNSVKADTARLAQKIDGGAEEPPMEEAMPPMEEAPAEVPPMEEPVPPMEEAMPPAEASAPAAPAGDIFDGKWAEDETEDETLSALQDALSTVTDPAAIVKLADIIKEYVASNNVQEEIPVLEAPVEEVIPEEVIEALIEEAPVEEMPIEAEPVIDEIPEELLAAISKSLGREEPIQKACDGDAKQPESIAASEDAPAEVGTAEEVQVSDDEEEPEPAIQINLFLGAKMEDIIDENAEKGLTDKDELDTESFKVCDPAPMKKSIDDLMNQRMRAQSGVDGKRYKISKSASEIAAEELQTVQKSIGSFEAVKDMRVGDILGVMQDLGKRGMTSIEKSYAPLIDEMVKYCDNRISPIYTDPLFKSFGLDIGKTYEPLDTTSFERDARFKRPDFATAMAGGDADKELAANELLDSYINAISQNMSDVDEMGDMDDATFKEYLLNTLLNGDDSNLARAILDSDKGADMIPGLKEAYRSLSGGKTFMKEGGWKLRDILNRAKGYNQARGVRDRSAKDLEGKGVYPTSQGVTAPDSNIASKETRLKDLDRDKMDIDAFLSAMEGANPEEFAQLITELGLDPANVDNATVRDSLYNILRDQSGVGQFGGKDAPYAFKFDAEGNQIPQEYLDYNKEFLPGFLDEAGSVKEAPKELKALIAAAKDNLAKKGYVKYNDTRSILEALDAADSTRPLADKYYNAVGDSRRTAGSGMTTRKVVPSKIPAAWSKYVTPAYGEGFAQDRLTLNEEGRKVMDAGNGDATMESVMDKVVLPIFKEGATYADTTADDLKGYNKQYKTIGGGREARNAAVNFGKTLARRAPEETYAMMHSMAKLGNAGMFRPGDSYDFIRETLIPSQMFRGLSDEFVQGMNERENFINPPAKTEEDAAPGAGQEDVDERDRSKE